MTISELDAKAERLEFTNEYMDVHLVDGRLLRVPLDWYPRLEWATHKQRKHYELIYDGEAIHWPDIDEDISIAGLLKGNKAPRTLPYLTGKWPEHIERERKRIEKSFSAKKPIASKLRKRAGAKSAA
jgi:hypothetical protein